MDINSENSQNNIQLRKLITKDLTDVLIRFALVIFLVFISLKIFSPFMGLMLWALILAVTLYPLQLKLARRLGGKQGRAATIIVLAGVLIVGGPTIMLSGSLVDFVQETHTSIKNDTFTLKRPPQSVAKWPVVGKKIYSVWQHAATDLPQFIKEHKAQITELSKSALGYATGFISGILQFIFSMIIAGIMLAWGKKGSEAMLEISYRIAGLKKGQALHKLITATFRSVSMGVIGVAFIQGILIGVGLVLIDFPLAGLMALVMLVLGIAQLPALIISLPAIAYLWYTGDSTVFSPP